MRDLQVFSPSHMSKCPYTKPKKWVLLWSIAYFKTIFSNLMELPSVLPAESAAEKCTLLLLTASSSFANHWLPNSSQLHVTNLQNQWQWTSSSEATAQSTAPCDRWPDRRTWLLVIRDLESRRVIITNFVCSRITVSQNINLIVICQNCGFVAFGLPSLVIWFGFFLRIAPALPSTRKVQNGWT